MTRLKTLAAAAAAVLIFISSSAFAEMANGSYSRHFMSSEAPVWDISGDYSDSDIGLGSMDFTLTEDPSGVLTGAGTFSVNDLDVILSGTFTVIGKVKSAGIATRVSMKFLLSGTGTVDGDPVIFVATATANSEIDPVELELVLTNGRVKVKLVDLNTGRKGSFSEPLDPEATADLPLDSTGDWDLMLDLTPDGTKYDSLASTGRVDTSTGAMVDFTAKGSYSSKTDRSKISLKGPKGTGASLNLLITTDPGLTVLSAKGKLYGQKVNFIAP